MIMKNTMGQELKVKHTQELMKNTMGQDLKVKYKQELMWSATS